MLALFYGGSGSGKSALAESMFPGPGPRVYIATMQPHDEEARRRISRHQTARAHKGFMTLERYTDLAGADLPPGVDVLLECLGNLVANEMFSPGGAGASTEEAVLQGVRWISQHARRVVVVSNDIICDGIDYPLETAAYLRVLASLNRTLAAESALVVETVCGIPIRHKNDGTWE